ncbi:MAG: helix-turn-helix domain-containing protein [Bacteroidota bacterium]
MTTEQRKAAAITRGLWLDQNRRLTQEDVASMLSVSVRTVEKMRLRGELSFRHLAGRWTISRHDLDRDLDALG